MANNNQGMNQNYYQKVQNFLTCFGQMQPGNTDLFNFNLKSDGSMLLNKINSSILIEYHPHPLYSCYTPERKNSSKYWGCKKCGCNYDFNVPSFYCTACDYDFCQKCLLECQLLKIQLYNYTMNENFNVNTNINHRNYKPHIHNHIMALISIENYNQSNYVLHCRRCRNDIRNTDFFYYCSLCNFYVCQKCFNSQPPQQFMMNPFNNQQNSQFNNNQINNQMNGNNNNYQNYNQVFNYNNNNNNQINNPNAINQSMQNNSTNDMDNNNYNNNFNISGNNLQNQLNNNNIHNNNPNQRINNPFHLSQPKDELDDYLAGDQLKPK